MPLGSSSTVGAGSLQTGGFRGPLEELLTRDGIAYDMVGSQRSGPPSMADPDHEGHGGATIPQLLPQVGGWITRQHPDLVLLQVGTNDLLGGASAADTAGRLDAMLAAIHAAGPVPVIVAGVWAPLENRKRARAEYPALAAAVVGRWQARGDRVRFVDTGTLLGPAEIADGLHPNTAGAVKIAAMWEREIRDFVAHR